MNRLFNNYKLKAKHDHKGNIVFIYDNAAMGLFISLTAFLMAGLSIFVLLDSFNIVFAFFLIVSGVTGVTGVCGLRAMLTGTKVTFNKLDNSVQWNKINFFNKSCTTYKLADIRLIFQEIRIKRWRERKIRIWQAFAITLQNKDNEFINLAQNYHKDPLREYARQTENLLSIKVEVRDLNKPVIDGAATMMGRGLYND